MAKAKDRSPFNDTHRQRIKELRQKIKGTEAFGIKCQRCKLDVEDELQATKDQLEVLDAILKEFFPNSAE